MDIDHVVCTRDEADLDDMRRIVVCVVSRVELVSVLVHCLDSESLCLDRVNSIDRTAPSCASISEYYLALPKLSIEDVCKQQISSRILRHIDGHIVPS